MLFDNYKITNHIRLIELFAGIGSQAMALRDIGADFEHYMVVERVKQLGNIYGKNEGTGHAGNIWDKNALSPTLGTMQGGNRQPMIVDTMLLAGYRIRKLTPCECWRLMGFSDDDFSKAAAVNSNSQLYKQAGNSIVKDVLMAIFRQML